VFGDTVDRALAYIWLAFNLLDSLLSYIIISLGGIELNLVYRMTGNMDIVTALKWAVVFAVPLVLNRYKQTRLLLFFNVLPAFAVGWNIGQLIFCRG